MILFVKVEIELKYVFLFYWQTRTPNQDDIHITS